MAVSSSRSNANFGTALAAIDRAYRLSYHQTMSLLRGLFWLVLFVFFTFCFVVLFEYGTHDFTSGFKQEGQRLISFVKDAGKPSSKAPKK
jgi:hypothetical protein